MDRPYSIEYPEPSGPPQLTTFYSFKGGVGRTQSLYNVGVRLAALRRKVLMVDVDLEAPGLSIGTLEERERNSKDGFAEIAADLLLDLEITLDQGPSFFAEVVEDYQRRLEHSLHVLDVPMPPRHEGLAERLREEMGVTNLPTGSLALLSSGRIDPDYPRKMIDVKIDEAFKHELSEEQQDRLPELLDAAGLNLAGVPDNLGLVFTAVLRFLIRNATDPKTKDRFRHVLIDSRSGLADVGGLCLRGLPDTRVVLSGLNKQNLEGTRMVLNTLSREQRGGGELIVVFSPVPEGEASLVDERIETAKKTLTFRDPDGKDQISEGQIRLLHYHPRIALEETPFTEPFHERTRIYDEYEGLTDRLLALTGSDVESLIGRALDRFSEEDTDDEHPYQRLARDLLPASFVDAERVESVVDGYCSPLTRFEQYKTEALPLFDLWTALSLFLSADEVRTLEATAYYYAGVGRLVASDSADEETERFFQRSLDLDERITDLTPREERPWLNWGTHLSSLAQLVQDDNPSRAEDYFRSALEKYQKAIEINQDNHQAWHNWGNDLGRLAQLVQADNPERAVSLYSEAFEKFQKATEAKSSDYRAWHNWGSDLSNLAQLIQDDNPDRAQALYEEAFEKYQKAVEIHPDKEEAWHNWGTDLGRLAQLVQDDDVDRAVSLYQKAREKYQEATEIKSNNYQTWENWGIYLIRLSRLLRFRKQTEEAREVLSDAIDKLGEARGIAGGVIPLEWTIAAFEQGDQNEFDYLDAEPAPIFWLIIALAEWEQHHHSQDDYYIEAPDLLNIFLAENPALVSCFNVEDAKAVREHPQLREILDAYRERAETEAEEEPESSDLPDDLSPDLEDTSPN